MADGIVGVSGIYVIRHIKSGRIYVGSSVDVSRRWGQHRRRLDAGNHHSAKLQNAWNKYGRDWFDFCLVEVVASNEALIPIEQSWIDALKPFYNISPTAGSPLGTKQSEETRRKKSNSMKGRKFSEDTLSLMRQAAKRRGIAPEIAKMGQRAAAKKLKGKKLTKEHVAAIQESRAGFRHSDESKRKMSASKTGMVRGPISDSHKTSLSAALKGKKPTDSQRQKMSESAKRRGAPVLTEEQRERGNEKRRGAKRSEEQKQRMRDANSVRPIRVRTEEEIARRSDSIKAAWAKRKMNLLKALEDMVATPSIEPPGRAPDGQAFQK